MANDPPQERVIALLITLLILSVTLIVEKAAADYRPSGSLIAWGDNFRGQCNVPDGNDYIAVAAGYEHSLALKADGSVVAWGWNQHGECDVPDGNDFVAISAGKHHNLALRADGTVETWGQAPHWNSDGTLYRFEPNIPDGDFVSVAAGWYHSIGIRTDRSLAVWGEDWDEQLDTIPAGHEFIAVAGGKHLSAALDVNGTITSWGGYPIPPAGTGYIDIACGQHHGLALHGSGTVAAWGANDFGQLDIPQRLLGSGVVTIATMDFTNMALKRDGSLVVWGRTDYGQDQIPEQGPYVAIAVGGFHCLAIRAEGNVHGSQDNNYNEPDLVIDGTLFNALAKDWNRQAESVTTGSIVAWGGNETGQCNVPDGNDYIALAAGEYHSLALRADGTVAAWGENSFGQAETPEGTFCAIDAGMFHNLGLQTDGSLKTWGQTPGWVTPEGNDYIAIAAGWWHNLALRTDGSIIAWGDNWDNQLDTVPAGHDYMALAGGKHLSAALRQDGSIVSWGGTMLLTNVPQGNQYCAIDCGQGHGLALTTEGAVVEWGSAHTGPIPDYLSGRNAQVMAIATHDSTNMALNSDGTLTVWGWMNYGQDRIPEVDDVFAIAVGGQHCLALCAEGTAYKSFVGDISGPEGEPDHIVNWYDWNAMVEQWKKSE